MLHYAMGHPFSPDTCLAASIRAHYNQDHKTNQNHAQTTTDYNEYN
jgi:hypothetical protein